MTALPHQLYADRCNAPIQIGYGECPKSHGNILFNFGREIPPFYEQFPHVIEIVFTDPVVQQLARQRYKQYRDSHHEINTIKQSSKYD